MASLINFIFIECTRSVSTSMADLSDAAIEEILKLRVGFNKFTWQKFHNKNIIQEGLLF